MKKKRKRKKKVVYVLRQQFKVFRLVNFPGKIPREIYLGKVWAKHELDALALAAKQFPRRTIVAKKS